MIKRSLAKRYAQALLELVGDDAPNVAQRLYFFAKLLHDNPLLKEVLVSPAFQLEERNNVFKQVLAHLGWGAPLDRFLWYLIEHRRMKWMDSIAESFMFMVDEREGKVRIQVTSAQPLDKTTENQLLTSLNKNMGGKVVLEQLVDESLLAGMSLRIGDLVIDGSLKTQLTKLKELLLQQKATATG